MAIRYSDNSPGRHPRRTRPALLAGFIALGLACGLAFGGPAAAGYIQIEAVADVKTRYSRGCETAEDIARLAARKGVDAVLFGDRARDSLEYGAWPLERILKKTLSGPSLLATGASTYLSEINVLNDQLKDTVLIPGTEVTPFYYWTGSSWEDDLVAHDADRHLWLLGLPTAESYEQLPIVGNNFSARYAGRFQNAAIGAAFLFLATLVLAVRNRRRWLWVPLAIFFFLLALNNHPFRSSPFDPYQGDQGLLPTQEVIDYVKEKGGMAFLSGLESPPEPRTVGSVGFETAPYPDDLIHATGLTGFQAASPSPVLAVQPGQQWDRALLDHVSGKRAPVWGYGGNDFACENMEGPLFGSVRTVFLVREKTREAILDAMALGRMYAVREPDDSRLSLDEFLVVEQALGHKAVMGETLVSTGVPEIRLKIRATRGGKKTARLTLVRNGEVLREETVSLPYRMVHRDVNVAQEGTVYYRVLVNASEVDHLVSNPIFVHFPGRAAETVQQAKQPSKPARPPAPPAQPAQPDVPAKPESASEAAPEEVAALKPAPGTPAAAGSAPQPEKPETPQPEPPPPPKPVQPPPPAPRPRPAAPAADETVNYVTIATDRANLRSGPGTIFPKVGQAQKGDHLRLVRRTRIEWNGSAWLMVDTGTRRAYLWEGLVRAE